MSLVSIAQAQPVTLTARWRQRIALWLMTASGFAGLGYEIVWTQQCALWLGHEAAAVLAVITAFFGGLAIGAFALGPRLQMSRRPLYWYAGCELLIAAWSAALLILMRPYSNWMLHITGVQPAASWQWAVTFCGTFVLLLPATVAMGVSLPAMERTIAPGGEKTSSLAALYAGNTFGAVLGVLLAAFWLIPDFGLTRTACACIAVSLLCSALSLAVFSHEPSVPAERPSHVRSGVGALITLALTGFLGIGYEVLVVRVLSEVTENTVYTFALLLAVYLAGTAAGAAGYRHLKRNHAARADEKIEAAAPSDSLLALLAAACLFGIASLWVAEHVLTATQRILGADMKAALISEALLALIAFGPSTIVMGGVFCQLSDRANAMGIGFGRALGANTLGAAAAAPAFGVLVLPTLGAKLALLSIVVGYLLLTHRRYWTQPMVWAPLLTCVVLAVWAPRLAFIDVPPHGRVLSYQEGVMAAVSVTEDADGVRVLRINNRQQEGSSVSLRVDGRQAWLPLLLHPAPRHALFLGLGTGVTASSAAQDPRLQVDAVELLPEVIAASAQFRREASNDNDSDHQRLQLITADARRYVQASERRYDVIVADNFHPARSGSGSLYTVEHFTAVRRRLNEHGVFCQWLPLHQLDLDTLRSIVRSFMSVYPNGSALLANNSLETPVLGLIGRGDGERFDVASLRARQAQLPPQTPADFGLEDDFALFGSFVAGPAALQQFASAAPLNTDDHPVVAYRAPRITYAPDSQPRDRLMALLRTLSVAPDELVAYADESWEQRLTAYWTARRRFIESGRDVHPAADVRGVLQQVRDPLLSVLRISPDFRPAYDPLLRMAAALARTDETAARSLLTQLMNAQPARPEAAEMLREITASR